MKIVSVLKGGQPDRRDPIAAFVVHGTGETDLAKCLALYKKPSGIGPHYLVALDGTVYYVVDERQVAYHAATPPSEASLYRTGWQNWSRFKWDSGVAVDTGGQFPGYRAWREQWFNRGYQSPLDLATRGRTNSTSIGIELQSPAKRTSKIYHPAQYAALADLLNDAGRRNKIAINRETVLGHSDVNPLRRCNESGCWDPGVRFDWFYLWDLVTAKAPASLQP